MQLKKTAVCLLSILLIIMVVMPAASSGGTKDGQGQSTVYLKNNIHGTERYSGGTRSIRASYANFVGEYNNHVIIPVNTPVVVTKVSDRGIVMISSTDQTEITVEYNVKNMAGVSAQEYVGYITSPQKTSMKSLSPIDQRGVKDGKAYKGMSKDAVRIALGYPALHRTPSLKENVWIYWKNRFATGSVEFDAKGRVMSVQ